MSIVHHGLNRSLNPEDLHVFTDHAITKDEAERIAYSLDNGCDFPYGNGLAGVVILHEDMNGNHFEQFRPHNSRTDEDGRPRKYVFHKGQSPKLVKVRWNDTNTRVLIVEGTRQMYAAGIHAPLEYNVLGISGCWGWSKDGLPPNLDFVKGKDVVLVFDADVSTNRRVHQAAKSLRGHLTNAGVEKVSFVHLDDHGDGSDGLDDILARIEEPKRTEAMRGIIGGARALGHEPPPENGFNVTSDAVAIRELKRIIGTDQLANTFYVGSELSWMNGGGELVPVGPNQLSALMSDRFKVYRTVEDKKTGERSNVEHTVSIEITKRVTDFPERLDNVRDLHGFIRVPTPRADGTLISNPGYDEESGMYYTPSVEVPDVPSNPSKAQVKEAREYLLDELLSGFPFEHKDNDRANMIGLMLSPLLRQIVPPPYKMGIITATQRGTGKGYLTNMMITLYGGELETQFVTDKDELRKRVTSLLTTTTGTVIAFDNVVGTVKSPVLDSLLTSRKITDRTLGTNDSVKLVNDRVWMLNGNNVEIGGDLSRRVLWIGMHYPGPNPEKRKPDEFKIPDFENHVKENRGKILHALLTLIAAWVDNGKPIEYQSTDSFARWSGIVRGILKVAEIPGDFDTPREEGSNSNSEESDTGSFYRALSERFGDNPFTVKDVLEALTKTDGNDPYASEPMDATELPDELMEEYKRDITLGRASFSRKLGKWFNRMSGSWADGLSVEAIDNGTKSKKAKQYRIKGV